MYSVLAEPEKLRNVTTNYTTEGLHLTWLPLKGYALAIMLKWKIGDASEVLYSL